MTTYYVDVGENCPPMGPYKVLEALGFSLKSVLFAIRLGEETVVGGKILNRIVFAGEVVEGSRYDVHPISIKHGEGGSVEITCNVMNSVGSFEPQRHIYLEQTTTLSYGGTSDKTKVKEALCLMLGIDPKSLSFLMLNQVYDLCLPEEC